LHVAIAEGYIVAYADKGIIAICEDNFEGIQLVCMSGLITHTIPDNSYTIGFHPVIHLTADGRTGINIRPKSR